MSAVYYHYNPDELVQKAPFSISIVEHDVDLYWHMGLSMYTEIENNNAKGKNTVAIFPVGPVFQHRRFITLLRKRSIDLSHMHIFFMDEYLDDEGNWIAKDNFLSFRGFIERELIEPMPQSYGMNAQQLHFPNPDNPDLYDQKIDDLGGATLCHAGVGIVGHLAFNEPENIDIRTFAQSPTRVVKLTRETIVTNSHTALRGLMN